MKQETTLSTLKSINIEKGLYVQKFAGGFSCIGFDVAERNIRAIYAWMNMKAPSVALGTSEHFAAYKEAADLGAKHATRTGLKCPAELRPELVGKEGLWASVVDDDTGDTETFVVGKSCGWMPCHLALKSARSTGGEAVYVPRNGRIVVHGRTRPKRDHHHLAAKRSK